MENKKLKMIRTDKIKVLFKQVKKYSDAASTSTSLDEIDASILCCYKLLNEIKIKRGEL